MTKIYIFKTKVDHYGFLTKLAAEKYNIDALSLKFARNEHCKPYFESLPDFNFNISHSEDLTVIAVSDQNIGVDTEKLRKPDFRVAKRFCEDEYNYIDKSSSPTTFFEIWTKKEAYVKMMGGTMAKNGGIDVSGEVSGAQFSFFDEDGHIITVCEALV